MADKGTRTIPLSKARLKKEYEQQNKLEEYKIIKEGSFMLNNKIYDGVWGYIQLKSYKIEGISQKFVYASHIEPGKILKDLNVSAIKELEPRGKDRKNQSTTRISRNTIKKNLDILQKMGLIVRGVIPKDNYGNKDVEVYFIQEEFDYYVNIPFDTLEFLMNFTNGNVIKVYAFLLNAYKWKYKMGSQYVFTLKELCEEIGYAYHSDNIRKITHILEGLKDLSMIDYVEYNQLSSTGQPYAQKKLTKVSLYRRSETDRMRSRGIDMKAMEQKFLEEDCF